MTAATVKASVKYFPLRQGDNTHPEVRKIFPETHENSESLKNWTTIAQSLKNQGKVEGKETETDHDHYRLVNGALADRHLGQICCIDNKHTGTQASVWCDSMRKQVLVRTIVVRS